MWYPAHVERPSEPPVTSTIVVAAIIFYGLMSVGALIAFSVADLNVSDTVFGAGLSPDGSAPDHIVHGLLGVGLGLAIVGSTWLMKRLGPLERLQREFADLLGPLPSSAIAILAVTSSIGEELLFRGALQPLIGFWPTAVIFGLLHGGMTPRLWTWTVFALLAGVLLGWLADYTGSLLAPILCHFTVNFWNLHALLADARPAVPTIGPPSRPGGPPSRPGGPGGPVKNIWRPRRDDVPDSDDDEEHDGDEVDRNDDKRPPP